jgi:hypothetical protein
MITQPQIHYGTVTEAIEKLRKQGYITDFTIKGNQFCCVLGNFKADEFAITDIYRYEGETDPADEATVYALKSDSGLKGIVVTGYGISSDTDAAELLNNLSLHKK